MRSRRKWRTSSLAGSKQAHVPALAAVDERVGLDRALGELVLVGLVVLEAQQVAGDDRLARPRGRPPSRRRLREAICRPCSIGSAPSAATIFVARAGQRALGQVLADEVDGGDQRLGLDGQQPRRAREVVGVGLGVDLDRAVVGDLGVEHVGAAAEVHDVQHVDVLAQLGVGDLQALAASISSRRCSPARPASIRIEASVTRRAKRSGRMAASRRPSSLSAGGSSSASSARADARRRASRARPVVELGQARDALGARRRPAPAGPRRGRARRGSAPTRRAGARSRTAVEKSTPSCAAAKLAEAPEVALDEPGDAVGDPHLGASPTGSPYCQSARLA